MAHPTPTPEPPILILVPGLCSVGSQIFRPLITALTTLGHPPTSTIVIDNPSVDAPSKGSLKSNPNGLTVDISHLRETLTQSIEVDHRDVLLVGHSYGATPSLSAAEGLWRHQRVARGLRGGVLRVAVISTSLTLPGHSIVEDRVKWMIENGVPLDPIETFEVNGEPYVDPTNLKPLWGNDIDPTDWPRDSLKPSPMNTLTTPIGDSVNPRNWRVSYLILTELDTAMPEKLQRDQIRAAREAGAEVEVGTMRSGHFAIISHAGEVAEWILGIVRGEGKVGGE